jgi:hypothetical protein
MACNCACSEVNDAAKAGLQPVDLLSLFLDVDAQLIAVLLLNLLISELFGLVTVLSSCATRLSPLTLRQRGFFLGLVLPGNSTLVVWRLNPHCALWHLYDIASFDVSSRQPSISQHAANILCPGFSYDFTVLL